MCVCLHKCFLVQLMALHRYKVTSQCMCVSTQVFLSAVDGIAQIQRHFSVYVCVWTMSCCTNVPLIAWSVIVCVCLSRSQLQVGDRIWVQFLVRDIYLGMSPVTHVML